MNAPLRHYHPNDPSGRDVDYFGRVAWFPKDDIWVRDLHLHEAIIEIIGTGGESYRVDTIKVGDGKLRELDFNDPFDAVIWSEVVKHITDEDVAEAFERG